MAMESFSEILGYVSIACWLFAQFPQVVENYRRGSCQGLAWPFLLNWLLGDASNLIGCILTNQLPFQTWLATYFVLVDCSLVGQYIYYERHRKGIPFPRGRRRASSRATSERRASTSRYRTLSSSGAPSALSPHADIHGRTIPRTPRRPSLEVTVESLPSPAEEGPNQFDNVLTDSLRSEGHSKRVSWSAERRRGGGLSTSAALARNSIPSILHLTTELAENEQPGESSRGRRLSRDVEILPDSEELRQGSSIRSTKHNHRSTAAAVFLGLCFVCVLQAHSQGLISSTSVGHVLVRTVGPNNRVEMEKIIGRIFAWLCTALYLTSRLPQIWKNFVRRSVEGLSMALFLFAFLGNTFYVASILTSPHAFEPESEFIRESIPYLLGSGGTLMFDVTILLQSLAYRRTHKRIEHRTRSRFITEEEQGLLSEQAV